MNRESKIAERVVAGMSRKEFQEAISKAPKASIRINNRLEVAMGADSIAEVEAKAKKALARGSTVTWQDGRTQWIERKAIFDSRKSGSDAYTWDNSGNKVLCNRVLNTKKGSRVTEKNMGKVWAKFDDVT